LTSLSRSRAEIALATFDKHVVVVTVDTDRVRVWDVWLGDLLADYCDLGSVVKAFVPMDEALGQ